MVNKLSETVYNILQLGDDPTLKGAEGKEKGGVNAKEAFLTVFNAYSQVSGNAHNTVLRKFFDEKDLNNW